LQNSDEHIATNILAARLEQLEKDGLITKKNDFSDKRKKRYELTQSGIDLIPLLLEMINWSSKHINNCNIPHGLVSRLESDRETLIRDLKERI